MTVARNIWVVAIDKVESPWLRPGRTGVPPPVGDSDRAHPEPRER